MKNFNYLFLGFPLISLLQSCNFSSQQDKSSGQREKPNVLFILADDQCFRTLQANGNSEIRTPNLDKLAKRGTLFTHAYNMGGWNGAVCVASRAQLITGSFIWNAYQYEEEYKNSVKPLSKPMWGNLMQQAGYETYMTGKWHIKRNPSEVFDYFIHERPGMPNQSEAGYNRPKSTSDTLWKPWKKEFDGFWKGGKHWSEVLGDDALTFIDSAKGQESPFFMYLAFNAPHDPRQSPKEFVEKYPLEKISIPENFLDRYPFAEQIGCDEKLRDERLAPFPRTEFAIKVNRQEYYAIITHMDQQIGRILDALEKSGKADNTYIIFSADHGLAVGEHGLIGKQNMYDHSMRVPFIITGPDIPANKKIDADIYYQDAMATSLELAGIEKPDYVEFNSVLDLVHGKRTESHYDAIYGCYIDFQRMIRKDGFKLIVYPKAEKILLYDVNNDPWEITDLSDLPEYQDKKRMMFNDLIELQQEMNDSLDLEAVFGSIL